MRKPRWQLSLATLFLLVTVMVLAISHYLTSRKLSATRNELVDYRYQYGHLVVDDPSRPHLLKYANQENPWKWHVNLPKGKIYQLMSGVGMVPSAGIPSVSQLRHLDATTVVGTGENVTMFVSLKEHDSETLMLSVGYEGATTMSRVISKSELSSVITTFSAGHREAFTADPDKAFVIFYYRQRKPMTGSDPTVDTSPTVGVVVWAVPVNDEAVVEPIE